MRSTSSWILHRNVQCPCPPTEVQKGNSSYPVSRAWKRETHPNLNYTIYALMSLNNLLAPSRIKLPAALNETN